MMSEKDYFDVSVMARKLKVTPEEIHEMARQCRLPFAWTDRGLVIREIDFPAWKSALHRAADDVCSGE